jgi:membrane protease YdiL (CAAX protease family)
MIANYVTSFIVALFKVFGYELTQSSSLDVDSPLTCIALIFSTAIVPAVCEEFAMRCCTLGALRKYGKGFSVFAVSIVFGLLHGNVIQFVFAFLVGLILAYITVRTDNVIIAMFVHGFNNGMSVLQDILGYAINENFAQNVASVVFVLWEILGILALIYLLVKKELLPPKTPKAPKDPYALSFGTKLLCLLPGFFVPFVLLIYLSATTIVSTS